MLNDLFENTKLDIGSITCHSGGAQGSDTYWENVGEQYNVRVKAYSYKTNYHNSKNKVEISDEDYKDGIEEINKANKILGRFGINKYMNLLARNWSQVKYSSQIFAIGYIVEPGGKTPKGYYSKSKFQSVDGGTGYAVQMGVNNKKDIYVFDQKVKSWFRWSYSTMTFIKLEDTPKIKTQNFAGIGTREISQDGIEAIKNVYSLTFGK